MSRLSGEQLVRLICVALFILAAVVLYVVGPKEAQLPAAGLLTASTAIAGGAFRSPPRPPSS